MSVTHGTSAAPPEAKSRSDAAPLGIAPKILLEQIRVIAHLMRNPARAFPRFEEQWARRPFKPRFLPF